MTLADAALYAATCGVRNGIVELTPSERDNHASA